MKNLSNLLKSGRIIEHRDGNVGIIIETHFGLLIQYDDMWDHIRDFDIMNLKHFKYKEMDIMRIRKITDGFQIIRSDFGDAEIIWEREE
jgi:hypothetical protein